MSWDLAQAKTYLGMTDTINDAAIQQTLDTVIATVEGILGRGLLLRRVTDVFLDPDTREIRLSRYPISRLIAINDAPPSSDTLVHHRGGWIEIGPMGFPAVRANRRKLEIEYEGGFDPLPSDLERVMWEAFQVVWGASDPVTGAPVAGGGTTVVAGSGEVSKIVLPDGGSVAFDVSSQVSGGAAAGGGGFGGDWGWLAPWAFVLSTYRSDSAPSIAMA